VLDHDGLDLVRHVVEVVDGPLQLVEDLATGEVTEDVLRAVRGGGTEQGRDARVVDVVDLAPMRLICSQYSLIRAAFLPIFESSGTASLTSPAQRTMASPMKSMFGSNSRISYVAMAFAVDFIWSIVSSIRLISVWMSPRSNGVTNVLRTPCATSRVIESAASSCASTSR
jgi:hypothetical protein